MTSVEARASSYPREREADVALKDGIIAHIRPVRASDQAGLVALFRALPPDDRRLRFFSLATDLERTARDEVNVDYVSSLGLVATVGREGRIVGHAMYAPVRDGKAEVAFTISPAYQGQGLASMLLGQLAEVAATHGIHTFEAVVLPDNKRMLDVFRASGFPIHTVATLGTVYVSFPTSLSTDGLMRFDAREEQSAANALRHVLYPRSIAVVGASRDPGSVGYAVLRNVLGSGFPGPVYAVNPAATCVQGLECFANVDAIPEPIDLAIVAVPAVHVLGVAEECGRHGARSLVVLSAGFAEVGGEGQQREAELVSLCRTYGMRLIGPNCIGVINTDPQSPLNATFGPLMSSPGSIGLATQSGALGLAAIDFASARGLGFSSIVSMGNKADISGNDLLGYWHSDPRTSVILLYLESFGNPRKFGRLARQIGRSKPIIALKSGRSVVGARATASHTGALLAASDVTVDALFRQAGVIRTDTLDEMLDVATLLARQPLPGGPRVAIVSNVGGPAVMCADACDARGLIVPPLSQHTREELGRLLPSAASTANPVDMLAEATAEQYLETLRIVTEDPSVDSVISIFLPPLRTPCTDVAAAIRAVKTNKPVLCVFMSSREQPSRTNDGLATYSMPEPAVAALAHAVRYAAWRAQSAEPAFTFDDVRRDEAAQLIADAIQHGDAWLGPSEIERLLDCYGITHADQRFVTSAEDAGAAAAALGGRVALKAVAPGLVHKSEHGAVQLGLSGASDVRSAAAGMSERVLQGIGERPTGFVVQRMLDQGVEMLVGVVSDRQFGPTVACGAGGVHAEILKDVAVRLAPLTATDAATMLRELKSFPVLDGYRGSPHLAVNALEEVVLRVSALAEHHPQIAELECNPVIVTECGAVVVDARVRVHDIDPPRPLGARR